MSKRGRRLIDSELTWILIVSAATVVATFGVLLALNGLDGLGSLVSPGS